MQTAKAKIEAIYPLQHLQRALLFHHLSAPNADQGLIQTRFRLAGPLNPEAFAAAWRATLDRHQALRASVHWEKVSKPVWVVHPAVEGSINHLDWSGLPESRQRQHMTDYLAEDRRRGMDLTQTPTSRLLLARLGPEAHFCCWTSHHLLLDGWSSGVILRDFLAHYEAATGGTTARLPPIPDHKPYFRHLQSRDEGLREQYWRERLSLLDKPSLLPAAEGQQRSLSRSLDPDFQQGFVAYCKRQQVTQNAVLQGLWAMLLGRYLQTGHVCFGISVNGRPPEVADMDQVAGMFARILPKVVDLNQANFFQRIQEESARDTAEQYVGLDEIAEWSGTDGLPFNSLLAVQNYPWTELSGGGLRVTEFAGDLTSLYPVTCMVLPREAWEVTIRYREGIAEALPQWLLEGYLSLISWVARQTDQSLPPVGELPPPPTDPTVPAPDDVVRPPYAAPTNGTQLRLAGLWEQLLPVDTVGIDDNFFHCGGTSLAALRLFARLERATGKNISPASLLLHPTIRQLARFLDDGEAASEWNNLVPQRVSGNLPPLFCFHGGLGYVLMYQSLTHHLHPQRPVYALQPNGIDGRSELDGSIEEMAAHYLAEIDKVGAPDPLILLGYCYSGVICVAIGRLLVEAGRPAPIIIGADIDPPGVLDQKGKWKWRQPGSLRWYWGHLRLGRWTDVGEQLAMELLTEQLLSENLRLRLRARRLKDGLVAAFRRYRAPEYGHPICLLRSQELRQWSSHSFVIESWRRISGDQLTIQDVPAGHAEIFQEPAVAETARLIEAYIANHSGTVATPPGLVSSNSTP
ncbi:thioesterase domain-containing protein/acyl carrier protein [Lewinella marina]|uniref:Carrier domain-containing protein n=1 Tax=Neolewinella marina TaxID=438751 RepID=A0A2G0CDP4_9BACT|nr:condensation domain-containing protein [Neolewinella marina]NJB85992.1 thioesterase domain-containing protein/acyl carrier protein [Neolewinella marina]PHK98040.1 hypothetical protein CGL56_12680 [Neolewinella marina]